jgi:hypothetical protein
MEKEIRIEAPEGYELDREKSTFEKIVFRQKDGLPMRWGDLKEIDGYYIGDVCEIHLICTQPPTAYNKSVWPTKEEAEAALALSQLLQLRNAWNGEWSPKTKGDELHYSIKAIDNGIDVDSWFHIMFPLSFKTRETAERFLDTFRDLIETAKPLL